MIPEIVTAIRIIGALALAIAIICLFIFLVKDDLKIEK